MRSFQTIRNSSRRKLAVSATKGDGLHMIWVPLSFADWVGGVAGQVRPIFVSWHSLEKRPGG